MDYFQQWQALPVEAAKWQTHSRLKANPLYLKISEIVQANSSSILDVGCGIGLDADLFQKIKYVGVDITPKFVAEAQSRGLDVRLGNCLDLFFGNNSFDTAYANSLLVHLPPEIWKLALKEMVRVAKKQVVTLEGEWKPKTEYVQSEKYLVHGEWLKFWNNAYGEEEVRMFMSPFTEKIEVYLWEGSQATVYRLKEVSD